MKLVFYKKQFKKDYKLIKKQYGKQISLLHTVIKLITLPESLDNKYKDHKLEGKYKNCRELHIKPDWLLIYQIDKNNNGNEIICFIRTGSHAELF